MNKSGNPMCLLNTCVDRCLQFDGVIGVYTRALLAP